MKKTMMLDRLINPSRYRFNNLRWFMKVIRNAVINGARVSRFLKIALKPAGFIVLIWNLFAMFY